MTLSNEKLEEIEVSSAATPLRNPFHQEDRSLVRVVVEESHLGRKFGCSSFSPGKLVTLRP